MDSELYADDPTARLVAARALPDRARRKLLAKHAVDWPADSPGSINAWLLLVTTKPPTWRDPLVLWRELPPTLGEPHEGFFYPDPLGFWAEVRMWAATVVGLSLPEALAVTTLLHGPTPECLQPRVTLYLDEQAAPEPPAGAVRHFIPDPYRSGQGYEGWWHTDADGTIVGKAPQHPAAHKLYRREDLQRFLTAPAAADRT